MAVALAACVALPTADAVPVPERMHAAAAGGTARPPEDEHATAARDRALGEADVVDETHVASETTTPAGTPRSDAALARDIAKATASRERDGRGP